VWLIDLACEVFVPGSWLISDCYRIVAGIVGRAGTSGRRFAVLVENNIFLSENYSNVLPFIPVDGMSRTP
jgi:hypothetical protein